MTVRWKGNEPRSGAPASIAAAARLATMIMATGLTACGSLVRMEPPAPDGPKISGLSSSRPGRWRVARSVSGFIWMSVPKRRCGPVSPGFA